jgi:diguanylate cyclase (GGDEF)-like protein/PAS domain S-box-containing protein
MPPHQEKTGRLLGGEELKKQAGDRAPSLWWVAAEIGEQALGQLDLRTGIVSFSHQLTDLLGRESGALDGSVRRYLLLIPRPERRSLIAALKRHLLAGDADFQFEHPISHANGGRRHLRAQVKVIRDESDAPSVVVGSYLDVTDLRAAESALSRAEAHLSAAQALANVGSWEADVTGKMWLTRQMLGILGLPETAGDVDYQKIIERVHDDDVRSLTDSLRGAVQNQIPAQIEYRVVRPDGQCRYIVGQAKPWRDVDGQLHLLGTAQDVTDGVNAAQTLQEAEAQFRAAVEASFDAILLLRNLIEEDRVIDFEIAELNRNAERMLSVERSDVLGQRLSRVVPQFEGDGAMDRYIKVAETNVPLDLEFLASDAEGRACWFHEQVVPIPGGVAITHADITDRKFAEARLRESELFTQRITSSTPDWVFIYDLLLDRTAYVNREPLRDLGYTSREVVELGSEGYFKLVHPDDRAMVGAFQSPRIRGDEVGEFTYRLLSASGAYRWVSTRFVLFQQDANGQPLQVLATTRDVTPQKLTEERLQLQMRSLNDAQVELQRRQNELESLNERLATLATRDGLTGLHNHRSLQDRLTEEVSRSDRTGRPASLIMVDVDRFKSYNDRYGHPAGDLVLRELAGVLAATARTSDFVARYGGEEFAVLLPDSRAADAAYLAERMRNKLNEVFFGEEKVTASFGCAEYIPGEMTKAELIQQADRALYRAKRDGRNCVRVAEHPTGADA